MHPIDQMSILSMTRDCSSNGGLLNFVSVSGGRNCFDLLNVAVSKPISLSTDRPVGFFVIDVMRVSSASRQLRGCKSRCTIPRA